MEAEKLLTSHQRDVLRRVLSQESARRTHLVVSLSGAHAYGFPSPDSDLDIKCVHLAPTSELLGFPRTEKAADRLEVIDGVEIDYTSNELGAVLLSVLKGNGNYIERFLSSYVLQSSADVEPLQPIIQRSLSKRVFRHYVGFATQQRLEWEKTERRSAKKLLYILRTALTGSHALFTGDVETDVTKLLARYGFPEALELVDQKKRGEKAELPLELSQKWTSRIAELFALLDKANAESKLPETALNEAEMEQWLVQRRLRQLG